MSKIAKRTSALKYSKAEKHWGSGRKKKNSNSPYTFERKRFHKASRQAAKEDCAYES